MNSKLNLNFSILVELKKEIGQIKNKLEKI